MRDADGEARPAATLTRRAQIDGKQRDPAAYADSAGRFGILLWMGVVLLGYRGSGKTSVGKVLAGRIGLPFIDLDATIVIKAGMTIREIFAARGEQGFRELESDVLHNAIDIDSVIATGGGIILLPENRAAIAKSPHARIYLMCNATVLHDRIHADPATAANRPALTHLGGGLAEIESLLAVRDPMYREVATAALDVTTLSVDEVVRQIEGLTVMPTHERHS